MPPHSRNFKPFHNYISDAFFAAAQQPERELPRLRAQLAAAQAKVAAAAAGEQVLGRRQAALEHLQRLPAEVLGLRVRALATPCPKP